MNNIFLALALNIILCVPGVWCAEKKYITNAAQIIYIWETLEHVANNEKNDPSIRECALENKKTFVEYARADNFMQSDDTLNITMTPDQCQTLTSSLRQQKRVSIADALVMTWGNRTNARIVKNKRYIAQKPPKPMLIVTKETREKYLNLLQPVMQKQLELYRKNLSLNT